VRISDELFAELKKLAARRTIDELADDAGVDFDVILDDETDGLPGEAHGAGVEDGATMLARDILEDVQA
jgi:hypothetical protein